MADEGFQPAPPFHLEDNENSLIDATDLPTIKPTVAEILSDPTNLTFRLRSHDADYPVYDFTDIIDTAQDVPELEALSRWAKVLHNQYPWDRSQAELVEVGQLQDDDYVTALREIFGADVVEQQKLDRFFLATQTP